MDARTAGEAASQFVRKMTEMGIVTRLVDLGITLPAQEPLLVESVNAQRLANNPRSVSDEDVRSIIHASA
jgi:alcohol dehydrogenase class IV